MSKFEEPRSAIDRVVGGEKRYQAALEKLNAKIFAEQDLPKLRDLERPPLPEELKIITVANRATDRILDQYGVGDFDIPFNNFHPVPEEKWPEYVARTGTSENAFGTYRLDQQAAAFRVSDSKLAMASEIVHEMVHFKSFQSVTAAVDESGNRVLVKERRVGLKTALKDGKNAFKLLNEAVTVELEQRAMKEVRQDPMFRNEIEELESIFKEHPEWRRDSISIRRMSEEESERTGYEYSRRIVAYPRPRAVLDKIVGALYEYNQHDFKSREEVFDLFARAALTGRMLVLGRVIEKTFGPGTFRELGECQTAEDLEEFAKSLKI